MRRVVTTQEAEADLEAIWLYSFERWNEAQADTYYDQLIDGIDKLIHYPELGQSRDAIREGYRSLQINRHVVYYRVEAQTIRVIRVLHERMMPSRYL